MPKPIDLRGRLETIAQLARDNADCAATLETELVGIWDLCEEMLEALDD